MIKYHLLLYEELYLLNEVLYHLQYDVLFLDRSRSSSLA